MTTGGRIPQHHRRLLVGQDRRSPAANHTGKKKKNDRVVARVSLKTGRSNLADKIQYRRHRLQLLQRYSPAALTTQQGKQTPSD